MKTKLLLKSLFFLSVLLSSCSRDEMEYSSVIENLSPHGEQFMQLLKSSGDWEYGWGKMDEIGVPMPNDVVYTYISSSGFYAVIPILSKEDKTIEAFAFYSVEQESNVVKLNDFPEIVQKDFIRDDVKSRLYIQTQSFAEWEKNGYKLTVKLDSFEKRIIPNKTKASYNSIFPFDFILTYSYSSTLDLHNLSKDVKNIIDRGMDVLPGGILYNLEWESDCIILTIDRTPSGSGDPQDVAMAYFRVVEQNLWSLPQVINVQFMCYWDMDQGGGGGGGSGSGGSGTNPPDTVEMSREDIIKQKAPRLSKIVNMDSNMTVEQWEEIEASLGEMIGINKLINTIESSGDNIINLSIDVNCESNLLGWDMTLKSTGYDQVAEEFFHAYQRACCGAPPILML